MKRKLPKPATVPEVEKGVGEWNCDIYRFNVKKPKSQPSSPEKPKTE